MSERHRRDVFFLADTRQMVGAVDRPATPGEQETSFRFSRLVPRTAPPPSAALLEALARAMVAAPPEIDGDVPAGYTYLAQFVDHDMTRDVTGVPLRTGVTVEQLKQGRSPALDLDSVYGLGPGHVHDGHYYQDDGARLRLGKTAAIGGAPSNRPFDGFDLPRLSVRATVELDRRKADIPDQRNDENLAVAQVHLAFMRFHNATVNRLAAQATPSALLFEAARDEVIKHYQWMLVHDFLPRVVDPAIVSDVFANGRKVVDVGATDVPAMPIEFSVGAYRFGHSMIRDQYDWNRFFHPRIGEAGRLAEGSLLNLFVFSGTSGTFSAGGNPDDPRPEDPFEQLPSNWIIDWTRFFDFVADAGRPDLSPAAPAGLNKARRIDTRLTDPLASLPLGAFDGRGSTPDSIERNLAFRNLVRSDMVSLATGQDVAAHFAALGANAPLLSPAALLTGNGDPHGVDLSALDAPLQDEFVGATPLWFYVLREAEVNGGKLGPVGGRIVAETFHRAIEGSRTSLLRDPAWRPVANGQGVQDFKMVDLLLTAFDAGKGELRPLADGAPVPALAVAP